MYQPTSQKRKNRTVLIPMERLLRLLQVLTSLQVKNQILTVMELPLHHHLDLQIHIDPHHPLPMDIRLLRKKQVPLINMAAHLLQNQVTANHLHLANRTMEASSLQEQSIKVSPWKKRLQSQLQVQYILNQLKKSHQVAINDHLHPHLDQAIATNNLHHSPTTTGHL